jgi:hypothetical protein
MNTLRFFDREFTPAEIEMIREVIEDFPSLSITELSRTLCELLEWRRANRGLKDHECRQMLERLQQRGLVNLPAVRRFGPTGCRIVEQTVRSDPQSEIVGSAGQLEPILLKLVTGQDVSESALWRELMARYHYLGYRAPVGATVRYTVYSQLYENRVLACMLWNSPAWRITVRDRWIGWNDQQRRRSLQLIVNNGRFLILPWVKVKGFASKILSHCVRQLPRDWERLYGYRPLLMETLVDGKRFSGTCYRAANWIGLGSTEGRGRMDRHHRSHQANPKVVYVYPLCRHVKERLVQK